LSVDDARSYCDKQSEFGELASVPHADQYYVHNDCQCNQLLACTNRVVCNWIKPEDQAIERLKGLARKLADHFGKRQPLSFADWTSNFAGRKMQRYKDAQATLETIPLCRKDSYIQAFVKLERLVDPGKDPRMIQARGARYNIELGNYLKAIEHDLYELRGVGRLASILPPGRVVVKGLNQEARAALIQSKWSRFKRPVQLALDCSRFDGHCSRKLLEVEHLVYNRVFDSPYLQKILSWQLRNKCFTKSGVKYETEGRRMSGDMNTALGNCVLMILMVADAMKLIGAKPNQWDIADDGDDCCLLVEEDIAEVVQFSLPRLFRTYGHELKIESIARNLQEVELCGCKPIRVGGKLKMILKPGRTMGKALTHPKVWALPFRAAYVATVGQCHMALNSGVPILQEFALLLRRAHPTLLRELPRSYLYRLGGETDPWIAEPSVITDEAREDFSLAFGITSEEQIQAERFMSEMTGDQLLRLAPHREVLADKRDDKHHSLFYLD